MAIAFSAYIAIQYFFSKGRGIGIMMTFVFIVAVLFVATSFLDILFSSDLRFSKGFDSDGRSELRNVAWEYIFNNPFGGAFEFFDANNRPPHNYFTNAFLYGGIVGGICLIVLLILQVIRIFPYVIHNPKTNNEQWAFIFGLMYIDLSINSMVHNASLVTAQSIYFYVCWGAFLAFATLEEKEKKVKKINPTTQISV